MGVATHIESPLRAVHERIARACREARRDPASVTLVAISKTFGPEAIEPVIACGQRVFGENRVQEAKGKWPALRARHPGLELHLVGPLQSNKTTKAAELFDAVDTVDSTRIASRLNHTARELGKKLPVDIRKQFVSLMSAWTTDARNLYNPKSRFIDYVVPGVIGLILQLLTVTLMAVPRL